MEIYNKEEIEVLGETYENNDIKYLGDKEESTKEIIKYYWPILLNRIKEVCKKENKLLDNLDNIKYKLNTEIVADKISKYNFRFEVYLDTKVGEIYLMGFTLSESGNCCGSMFLHGLDLDRAWMQCKGLGKIMLIIAEDVVTAQNSYNLLCINVADRNFNAHLIKRGFKIVNQFYNMNSDNICHLFNKNLEDYFEKRKIEVNKL